MKDLLLSLAIMLLIPVWGSAAVIRVPADFATIQAGIDAAVTGDTVLVSDGTYQGEGFRDIRFLGKAIVVRSENGREHCTIKGTADYASDYRAFIFDHNETDQSVLRDLSIIDFWRPGSGTGIMMFESFATVRHCEFRNNRNFGGGGAIDIILAPDTVSISDCVFSGNDAHNSGGAIKVSTSSIEFTGNTFIGNVGSFDGGAVGLWQTTGTIADCVFDSNTNVARWSLEDSYGGAIAAWRSAITIINCLIINNIGRGIAQQPYAYSVNGGGVFLDSYQQSEPNKMINCTIYGNRIEISGNNGGVSANPDIIVRNCVIWNNEPGNYRGSQFDVQYCVIPEGHFGEGNITDDPQFFVPENNLYYFLSSSPCIDSGHALSADICFNTPDGEVCLDELFTSVSGIPDGGIVERGYHYSEPCAIPTPTPVPSPTPTPNPCNNTGVEIFMPSHHYLPGDSCECSVTVCNMNQSVLENYPLIVILDVYGEYFFGPSFTLEFDSYLESYSEFSPGKTPVVVIPAFLWPENAGSSDGLYFYAALMNPLITQIVGEWDSWEFGWGEM